MHYDLPITVNLSRSERKVIEFIARTRYSNDRAAHLGDRRVQEDPNGFGWKRDLIGFAAEFGFAKALNLMPDFTTQPRAGGVDAHMAGIRVDVKGTTDPTGRLIAPTKSADKYDIDIFVLTLVDLPFSDAGKQYLDQEASVTVVGWAWKDDLVNPISIINLTKRDSGECVPTYVLGRSQLHTEIFTDGSGMNPDRFRSVHLPKQDGALAALFEELM